MVRPVRDRPVRDLRKRQLPDARAVHACGGNVGMALLMEEELEARRRQRALSEQLARENEEKQKRWQRLHEQALVEKLERLKRGEPPTPPQERRPDPMPDPAVLAIRSASHYAGASTFGFGSASGPLRHTAERKTVYHAEPCWTGHTPGAVCSRRGIGCPLPHPFG